MYRRYDRQPSESGKWQRLHHTGLSQVWHQRLDEWTIEVTHRRVGTTIPRDVFSAMIRCDEPPHEEFLSGFSNQAAAVQAAEKRVEMLRYLAQRRRVRFPSGWNTRRSSR